jgi:hypothetical protein
VLSFMASIVSVLLKRSDVSVASHRKASQSKLLSQSAVNLSSLLRPLQLLNLFMGPQWRGVGVLTRLSMSSGGD